MRERLLLRGTAVATTLLLAGCPAPKRDGVEITPTTPGVSSPTHTTEPVLQMPPPNLQRSSGNLIACFSGNTLPLPERKKPVGNSLELNIDRNGFITGTEKPPREVINALAAATVDIRFDLGNGKRIEGSGVILEDGRILTARHVIPQDELNRITVIDNEGNNHQVTSACGGFYDQGKSASPSLQERRTVVDDFVVLQVDGKLPPGLMFGSEPAYGSTVYIAGHPTPQRLNPKEVVPGIVITGRDNTFQSAAVIGIGQNSTDPGDSGGAVVTEDLRLVGIYNSSTTFDQIVLGTNFSVFTTEDSLNGAHWTPISVIRAAVEAQKLQTS
jgi:S1-C subfamily serine protease